MANLWRVTRLSGDTGLPLIMKVPRIKGGEDPASIVGFEVEQMILPTLAGVHVPRFIAAGDLSEQPYIVMEYIPGDSLRARIDDAPLHMRSWREARVATALHDLHGRHVIIST
jgi:serine/threonine protein kinase